MRHLSNNTLAALLLSLLFLPIMGSCTLEDNSLFDKSSAERVNAEVARLQETILSAPQGRWVVDYYPGGSRADYGGFVMVAEFDKDGNVVFYQSDDNGKVFSSKSLYSVKKDYGITLNFDTYNDVLHWYSDPDLDYGGGKGLGYEGEFEFTLKEASSEEILMEGKKYKLPFRMTPLSGSPVEYLKAVYKIQEPFLVGVKGYEGSFCGMPAKVIADSPTRLRIQVGEEEGLLIFVYTDKGIRLMEPVTIAGRTLTSLSVRDGALVGEDTDLRPIVGENVIYKDEYIGEYLLTWGGNGPKKADVTIREAEDGSFLLEGLPFTIVFTYDKAEGLLHFYAQEVRTDPQVICCTWDSKVGTFTWGTSVGMYLMRDPEAPDGTTVLTLEHDGQLWINSKGIELSPSSWYLYNLDERKRYEGFGVSRMWDLRFTKK